ncbi:MAG: hypothetical protein ACK55Z_01050 [bacterium]
MMGSPSSPHPPPGDMGGFGVNQSRKRDSVGVCVCVKRETGRGWWSVVRSMRITGNP